MWKDPASLNCENINEKNWKHKAVSAAEIIIPSIIQRIDPITSSCTQNTRIKMPSRITAIVNKKNDIVFNLGPKDTTFTCKWQPLVHI